MIPNMDPRPEWLSSDLLDLVLRLRWVVARLGESELNNWWGTQDVLGATGEMVFRRGFPRSQAWARAQVVFAVARQRCAERFPDPRATTLWTLPATLEEAFEHRWSHWIEEGAAWGPWLQRVQDWNTPDLVSALQDLGVVAASDLQHWAGLEAQGASVPLPSQELTVDALRSLALGFAKGQRGNLVVPYLHLA